MNDTGGYALKPVVFLFNPRSGKERLRAKLGPILNIICRAGYLPSVYVTEGTDDARKVAREYGERADLFLCAGGDGTLNQVISGLMPLEKRPRLGYIPAGSTNDFARSLKLSGDMEKAARVAVSGRGRSFDIGRFGPDRYFVYVAAFGAFTEVSYTTPQDVKNILGYQAYLLEAVRHLASLKAYPMRLTYNETTLEGEFLIGMITNTTSVGGFKGIVQEHVTFDDGLFEGLFVRAPRTPEDLVAIVSSVFLKAEENDHVIRFQTARLTIETEEEVPWVLDGEYGGTPKRVVIENLPRAMEFCVDEQER